MASFYLAPAGAVWHSQRISPPWVSQRRGHSHDAAFFLRFHAEPERNVAFFFGLHREEGLMIERHDKHRGIPTTVTLSAEAHAVMREMLAGPKRIGVFLSSLILEERARIEERAKCTAELRALSQGLDSSNET